MFSFDTNIAVHAANAASDQHDPAYAFVASLGTDPDVAVCELMLVELYLKLRNRKIFTRPLSAAQAAGVCQTYRGNRAWKLVDAAPVMDEVWRLAAGRSFAFRRIIANGTNATSQTLQTERVWRQGRPRPTSSFPSWMSPVRLHLQRRGNGCEARVRTASFNSLRPTRLALDIDQ